MSINWDGITKLTDLKEKAAQARVTLADAAQSYDWVTVFELLSKNEAWVNTARPGGKSQFAPLHQVAHAGAPIEIAQRLIKMGAFRTLQNAQGERPVDVAEKKGHLHLREILTPKLMHQVPIGVLLKIQIHFHEIIRDRIDRHFPNHGLRLPELEPLLELNRPHMWFPVPGMYGGFSYRLESTGVEAKLVAESWSRIDGGSGQRHEITSRGSKLVDEGFV